MRVRWSVAEEDRHEVNRAAIQKMLADADAAEVKLEGCIVPVQRTRSAGISHLASLADKVRAWADSIEAKPQPLLDCLQLLASQVPQEIAEHALRRNGMAATEPAPDQGAVEPASLALESSF